MVWIPIDTACRRREGFSLVSWGTVSPGTELVALGLSVDMKRKQRNTPQLGLGIQDARPQAGSKVWMITSSEAGTNEKYEKRQGRWGALMIHAKCVGQFIG